ncbi:putative integral membrane protein [Lasiodiplodia theobromae]|nr:putative integral membrane protein [Lasiodiplodia theobromae]
MLCIAWTFSIALTVLSCVLTDYGAGIHTDELPYWALKTNRKLQYASLLLYNLTLSLTKITICLFYLDIFADPLNRRLALAALTFIVLYTIPLETMSIFQCTPIAGYWDKEVAATATCVPMQPHFYVSAVCNMLADAWLAVQVVPNILPLQIPRRQKIVLLFVVSLGWLVIVASIIRLVRISAIPDGTDFTWASYDITIWSAVEVDTGLVCVAAPSTKPLFKKIAPEFLKSLGSSSSSSETFGPDGVAPGSYPLQSIAGTQGPGRWRHGGSKGTLRLNSVTEEREEEDTVAAAIAAKEIEVGGGDAPGWGVGGLLRSLSGKRNKRGSLASTVSTESTGMGEIMKRVELTVETTERDVEMGDGRRSFGGFRNAGSGWRNSWRPQFMTKM